MVNGRGSYCFVGLAVVWLSVGLAVQSSQTALGTEDETPSQPSSAEPLTELNGNPGREFGASAADSTTSASDNAPEESPSRMEAAKTNGEVKVRRKLVFERMTPVQRAKVILGLTSVVLLGAVLVFTAWIAARAARRYIRSADELRRRATLVDVDDWARKPLIPPLDESSKS